MNFGSSSSPWCEYLGRFHINDALDHPMMIKIHGRGGIFFFDFNSVRRVVSSVPCSVHLIGRAVLQVQVPAKRNFHF
jgi:hypothetical protein